MLDFGCAAKKILEAFAAEQIDAYIVGGALRDALLSRPIHDIDIATAAPWHSAETVLKRLGAHVERTGVAHGTITAIYQDTPYEITSFRTEGTYSDSRHPDTISVAANIEEDVLRRDFTINALAYNPCAGVIDVVGGQADIKEKRIRTVGDPCARFAEDALRILRALRFASVLDFTIEPRTKEALFENAPYLSALSLERVGHELEELLCGVSAPRIVSEYYEILNFLFTGDYSGLACALQRVHEIRQEDTLPPAFAWALFLTYVPCDLKKLAVAKLTRVGAEKLRQAEQVFLAPERIYATRAIGKDKSAAFVNELTQFLEVIEVSRAQEKVACAKAVISRNLPTDPQELALTQKDFDNTATIFGHTRGIYQEALLRKSVRLGRVFTPEEQLKMLETFDTNYQKLLDFLKGKPHEKNYIGLELERFVLSEDNLPVFYEGEHGIDKFLHLWLKTRQSARPIHQNGRLLGVEENINIQVSADQIAASITLEPGSQLELSVGPATSSKLIYDVLVYLDEAIVQVAKKMGVSWHLVASGVHPRIKEINEIPLLPKARYRIMDAHFEGSGALGRHMMRKSASTQISLDVLDRIEDELALALALEPILYALSATSENSYARMRIWQDTDPLLTEFPSSFYKHPTLRAYADWLLSRPALFSLQYPDTPAASEELLAEQLLYETCSLDEIARIASSVFPPVRVHGIVELRAADALPPKEAAGLSALIETLFYNEHAAEKARALLSVSKVSKASVIDAKRELCENGAVAHIYGKRVTDIITSLFKIARSYVSAENEALLESFIAHSAKTHR